MSTSLIAADLRAQADTRIDAAIAEAHDQIRNGWKPSEIAAVMNDAATIIGDLLDQADAADENHSIITEHDERIAAMVRGFGWVS